MCISKYFNFIAEILAYCWPIHGRNYSVSYRTKRAKNRFFFFLCSFNSIVIAIEETQLPTFEPTSCFVVEMKSFESIRCSAWLRRNGERTPHLWDLWICVHNDAPFLHTDSPGVDQPRKPTTPLTIYPILISILNRVKQNWLTLTIGSFHIKTTKTCGHENSDFDKI